MKTPGQILLEITTTVYKAGFPWKEASLDMRERYEKVARLFLAAMKRSNPAAKPSKKV